MSKLSQWVLRNAKQQLAPGLILLMAACILLMITGNWNSWASERAEQKTDDAYTRADLTPLSTKVAGLVATVSVSDYQAVKAGDLLVQLRDDDFRAQVQQAEAAVAAGEVALINNQRQKELQDAHITQAVEGIHAAEADVTTAEAGIEAAKSAVTNPRSAMTGTKADVERTQSERRRQEALIAVESATRQKLEQVAADAQRFQAQLASREAEIAAATAQQAKRAALVVARTNLDYTRIVAPENGKVGERNVLPGQLVSPGTQVISLVQNNVWVQANYRETQVRHMHPGDPATIRLDAFPGVVLQGKVDHLAPASGSRFALLPPDNATGNFTKITQRVPVKILLDRGQPAIERLRDGLSVIAMVRTSSGGQ